MKECHASSTGSQMIPNLGKHQLYHMMKDRAAIEGSQQKWAARNLTTFDKGKSPSSGTKQPHPPAGQHIEPESIACPWGEEGRTVYWTVLVRMWEVCWGRWFFPLYWALLGLHQECCIQFWPLQYKKTMVTYWSESNWGPPKWLGGWGTWLRRAST